VANTCNICQPESVPSGCAARNLSRRRREPLATFLRLWYIYFALRICFWNPYWLRKLSSRNVWKETCDECLTTDPVSPSLLVGLSLPDMIIFKGYVSATQFAVIFAYLHMTANNITSRSLPWDLFTVSSQMCFSLACQEFQCSVVDVSRQPEQGTVVLYMVGRRY